MSDAPPPAADGGAAKSKKLPLILVAVTGLLAGIGGGALLAAPLFANRVAPASAAAAGASAGAQDKEKTGGGGEEHATDAPAPAVHTIDNLVMNPAGTGGTRFVMLTVTFQLAKADQAELLKERDAELRDLIVSLFSRKPVDELADASRRDSLRAEVAAAVAPILPKKAVRKVFFPQFVIQ
jgi:flagellar FliL protein